MCWKQPTQLRMKPLLTLIFESTTSDLVSFYLSDDDKVSGNSAGKKEPFPPIQLPLEQIPLSELHTKITAIEKHPINVVIPGEHITSKVVTVPKGSKRHIHQALPFLLEDELAAPVEELHFSFSKPNSESLVLCTMIAKSLLENYLEQLASVDIYPAILIPDYWLLPESNSPQLAESNHRLLIRLADNTGMVFPSHLPHALLNEALPTKSLPNKSLQSEDSGDLSIPPLNELHVNAAPLNVLQGDYAPVASSQNQSLWLRPTAIAAGICILVFMSYFLAAGYYFNQQAQTMTQEAKTTYQQLFPNETRIVDIRRQMTAHLSQSNHQQTDTLFFKLTDIVAQAITEETSENATIRHLRFEQSDATLQLELQTKSMSYAHNLQNRIQKTGLIAEVLSANSNDEGVLARLKLSENK